MGRFLPLACSTLMAIGSLSMPVALTSCAHHTEPAPPPKWSADLDRELGSLGYQNWIVVAETSYPLLSRRGVRTVMVDAEIPDLVDYIVDYFDRTETLRPSFTIAREIKHVRNEVAPGADEFHRTLKRALHGHQVREIDHRPITQIVQSETSRFNVLVIKTRTALPYSNVFIELDSGYWDRDAEDRLRSEMNKERAAPNPLDPAGP